MHDILLPRTDAGVLAQFTGVAVLTIAAAVALRRHAELRTLTTGIGVFVIALMAVRTLH